MAAPTLKLTFQDMQIRVAEYLGLADYSGSIAAVPSDTHDAGLVQRLVNDGYRRFVNSSNKWQFLMPLLEVQLEPVAATGSVTGNDGSDWEFDDSALSYTFATGDIVRWTSGNNAGEYQTIASVAGATVALTTTASNATVIGDEYQIVRLGAVEGEAYRYYMPAGFYGELLGSWTYEPSGPGTRIDVCEEQRIRELRQISASTGDPTLAAVRAIPSNPDSNSERWEVLFWPEPSTAYKVYVRGRIYPNQLSSNTDVTICGFQHDEAVLACALAEAELQRDGVMGQKHEAAVQAVQRAMMIDASASPRRLGDYGDRSEGRVESRRPWFTGVDTYNGIEV